MSFNDALLGNQTHRNSQSTNNIKCNRSHLLRRYEIKISRRSSLSDQYHIPIRWWSDLKSQQNHSPMRLISLDIRHKNSSMTHHCYEHKLMPKEYATNKHQQCTITKFPGPMHVLLHTKSNNYPEE